MLSQDSTCTLHPPPSPPSPTPPAPPGSKGSPSQQSGLAKTGLSNLLVIPPINLRHLPTKQASLPSGDTSPVFTGLLTPSASASASRQSSLTGSTTHEEYPLKEVIVSGGLTSPNRQSSTCSIYRPSSCLNGGIGFKADELKPVLSVKRLATKSNSTCCPEAVTGTFIDGSPKKSPKVTSSLQYPTPVNFLSS